MGQGPFGSNMQLQHFWLIRIVAQCPDTWARVQLVQIHDSNILESSDLLYELLQSVRTHGHGSNRYKYPILTCLPNYNCCTVSEDIGPGLIGSNTRFRHFCPSRIVAKCPDTWAWAQLIQIPDSDISAWLELLHSVRTLWAKSIRIKDLIPTYLPD